MHAEDYIIKKNDLVRQWVAQGFVCKAHGRNPEDVAGGYFNELVNRSIIQPVDTEHNNEVSSCRVHDMMLDLIIHKCREENFITATDDIQTIRGLPDKIRRLSLYLDGIIDGAILETTQFSQVRALAVFGTSAYAPPLLKFKHLRVLTLEFQSGNHVSKIPDLAEMSQLFQLRYLKIKSDIKIVLPRKIGGLEQLETLELEVYSLEVPSDVIHLRRLLHLIMPSGKILPEGIGSMKSLFTMEEFDVGLNSIDNIRDLGDLINLRDLGICFTTLKPLDDMETRQRLDVLRCSLGKLRNLTYLHTDSDISSIYELSSLSASLCLRRLHMLHVFSRVPNWIGVLHNLFDLDLALEVLKDDIGILAQLQSLIHLKLHIHGTPEEKVVICRKGFPVLKHFRLSCISISELTFEEGAMPSLQKLEIRFNLQHTTPPIGIEHLLGLNEIFVSIGGYGAEECTTRSALSALGRSIDMCPSRPTANINCEKNSRFLRLPMDDGFNWRKYGHKNILDAKYPRGYYRCTHRNSQGCAATMKVQRRDDDPLLFQVVYHGKHTCNNCKLPLPQHGQALSRAIDTCPSRPTANIKCEKTSRFLRRPLDDGFSWRKYGQKDILDAKYPRSYYRCTHMSSQGCRAKKQVQRTDDDPLLFQVIYHRKHTCNIQKAPGATSPQHGQALTL